MKFPETLSVCVANIEEVTPLVKRFTLVPAEGGSLPGFSAGSHIMVHMPGEERTYRNAYSLMSAPNDRSCYQIGVRRQEESRGGSVYMHEKVKTGDLLRINPPANLFAIDRLSAKQILIAGGIGITPFMSYLKELPDLGVPFELHYAYRAQSHAAFRELIAAQLGGQLHTYDASRDEFIQPRVLLAAQPLGTHVYVCGPEGLIDAVVETARELGWPESHIHYEQFAAPQPGAPFKVSCAKQACEIDVPGDMSLLDALEAAGVDVPNMCRGGVCGQCETGLLEGEAEHRDNYLPDEARDRKIMPCVSRARSARLVLDL
ncbi:MAG: PDR/VanB family oxidoreductase [Gammaproteobacteria bacterium]